MDDPHVHVPYDRITDHLRFIKETRVNLEVYFSSQTLDAISSSDIIRLKENFDYNPSFTVHAPFMDLSPGAVDSKVRAVTIERFSRTMDIAETLEPRVIVFHSGYEKWKYALNTDLWLEKSLLTWKPLAERAADRGIRIAIENIFEDEPSNLRILMEAVDCRNFGICFDTGHFNLFSGIPLEEWLRQLKPYIVELHLHDNHKLSDEHIAVGDGTFDFAALFSAVRGMDVIHTIEGHTLEDVIKSIKRLRDYV